MTNYSPIWLPEPPLTTHSEIAEKANPGTTVTNSRRGDARIVRRSDYPLGSFGIASTIALFMGLALLSPLGLNLLARSFDADWMLLSNVGQSYGATAAIVSALALSGITASLIVQARQASAARLQATRASQMEIIRFALSEPAVMDDVRSDLSLSRDDYVRYVYRNYYFKYLEFALLTRTSSRTSIAHHLAESMRSPITQEFWRNAGPHYATDATTKMEKVFVRLVNEAYEKAPKTHSVEPEQPSADLPGADRGESRKYVLIACGAAAGLAVGAVLGRRRSN